MSTSPDPHARSPRAALPSGEGPAEADNLPALRSPGSVQRRPASPPAAHGGGQSGMPGPRSPGYAPAGHDGSSSWFSPGGPGPQDPGAYASGPQGYGQSPGYGQSGWRQGSGHSPQGYGGSGPSSGGYDAPGYGHSGSGQGSYGGYDQGGYGSPGYGTPGYGASGPGYGASGPGQGGSGSGYPAPGAHSARPSDFQSPAGPPQSPPAGFGAQPFGAGPLGDQPFGAEQAMPPASPTPTTVEVPDAPAPPTRAEQRPNLAPPADDSPFGPLPSGQQPAGGPRHAVPPPPPDEPQLYDAAAHEEALYRRMRSNGANSGSHRQPQPAPAFTASAPVPGAGAVPGANASGGSLRDPAFGGPGASRAGGDESTRNFGAGQYGSAPGYDGPGFGGPPPAALRRPRGKAAKKASGGRRDWVKFLVGAVAVIAVGGGLGAVIAPHIGTSASSDPGCKAYQSTALRAYDRTVGDLNAKARQPVLLSDLTATLTDLASAQGSARSAQVKTALSSLHDQLATVRADVVKGYIPPSAPTALNGAAHGADSAC